MDRFRFHVQRSDNGKEAMIAMDCGENVIRARHMPIQALRTLGEMCQALRDKANELLAHGMDVPAFPGYRHLLGGTMGGTCRATIGAHRTEDGPVERLIAVYDEDDDEAPVLVLVEEQIEEFIAKANPQD